VNCFKLIVPFYVEIYLLFIIELINFIYFNQGMVQHQNDVILCDPDRTAYIDGLFYDTSMK